MNYTLKNKIENIIDFEEKHHFAIKEGKVFNFETNQMINSIENQRQIYSFGNKFIISKDVRDGSSFIINILDFNIDNRFKIDAIKHPYFTFYGFENKEIEGVYNYQSQKIQFETTEWIGRDIIDEYIFSNYQNIITCRSIFLGNKLWQFDLSQFGTYYYIGDNLAYKVVQFIGIWNNLLLVQLTNARLIALDIKTGTLKKDLEINKTNPLETPLFYDYYSKMHLVGDTIIWLSNQTLLHIDLHTFSTKHIKEYYSVPREEQWQFKKTTYFNGKLYFTADYAWQYVTPTHIGLIDADTGKVLWSQQLKKTGGLPEAPKVTKDKLYIKTSTAMLHIFEKDPNESV